VDISKLDQLDMRLQKVDAQVRQAAETARFDQLDGKVKEIAESLRALDTRKADFSELELCHTELMALKLPVGQKADSVTVEKLDAAVRELSAGLTLKADAAVIDQVHSQYRAINTALAEKAEFAEVNQVKAQIHAMVGSLPQQRNLAVEMDRLNLAQQELRAENAATAAAVAGGQRLSDATALEVAQRQIDGLEEAVSRKADHAAVAEFCNQLSAQYNLLTGYISQRGVGGAGSAGGAGRAPVGLSNPWSPAPSSPRLRGNLRPQSASASRRNRLRPMAGTSLSRDLSGVCLP
jgi:hypothetical protein